MGGSHSSNQAWTDNKSIKNAGQHESESQDAKGRCMSQGWVMPAGRRLGSHHPHLVTAFSTLGQQLAKLGYRTEVFSCYASSVLCKAVSPSEPCARDAVPSGSSLGQSALLIAARSNSRMDC